ncbi:hypothetical protein JKP88DRAFT_202739 [Tribonema minus]|uniref:Diphthine--ammonia ligase n=1 Tax=Tribonema minus TaxID=303371 RepID=A0A835YTU4_9STRA|nr:hypothetical protein JKP88DRAFT_202739 [Tribonema minus]
MYQSAGHDAIESLAHCLDKPLIRRPILGSSSNQALHYQPTEGDEVEDLYLLLQDVKAAHPEVEAVASGAIFSTYQRTRVESVCSRIGLASLAPLWQRDQAELLQDMITSNMDAILIKVASLGLDPHKHLGKSVARLQPHFLTLAARHGFHVCGEGGEYETLTLDCPAFVRRLVLDETEVVMHSDDMFAPVALLRVVRCSTADKMAEERERDAQAMASIGHPDLRAAAELEQLLADSSGHIHVSSITCPPDSLPSATSAGDAAAAAAAQAIAALRALAAALAAHDASLADVVFVHLYLADMAHFAAVNAAYAAAFEPAAAAPPSRACVQARLPPPYAVMLDCVAQRGSAPRPRGPAQDRATLLVRSLSPWAPVCIGPYSQANCLVGSGALVLLSGQIGLLPCSMAVAPGGLDGELGWCVRHAARVLRALGASASRSVLCATLYVTASAAAAGATAAATARAQAAVAGGVAGCELAEAAAAPACNGSSSSSSGAAAAAASGGNSSGSALDGGAAQWWGQTRTRTLRLLRRNGGVSDTDACDRDSDSAEEGWDSQAEEEETPAAAQAARRVPLTIVALDALPRGCACELELAEALALALLQAARGAFDAALLEWRHVASLRVYHLSTIDGVLLRECVLLALGGLTRERPAITLIPVAGLEPGAVAVLHMTALDLPKLRTELWVQRAP